MSNLIPIPVPGANRQIIATSVDGRPLVSVRHACEAIGLEPARQMQKLNSKSWATVYMTDTVASDGKGRTLAMIDRRTFTMWLATIDTRRVSPEARPVLEAFQAEAADALDAYFNEGGAINPRATEDQLERIAREAQAQAGVLKALKGVVDPKHLEAKGRLILARAMGEKPELDRTAIPLYVSNFLASKGLKSDMVAAKAPGFGKRIKSRFIKEYDREPGRAYQELPNGTIREVYAYTEADRPLFESVWARDYATKVAESALTLLPGGDAS